MDGEKKGTKMSPEQVARHIRSVSIFLHNIQNKDHTYMSEMNKFKELFASMLNCMVLLS